MIHVRPMPVPVALDAIDEAMAVRACRAEVTDVTECPKGAHDSVLQIAGD